MKVLVVILLVIKLLLVLNLGGVWFVIIVVRSLFIAFLLEGVSLGMGGGVRLVLARVWRKLVVVVVRVKMSSNHPPQFDIGELARYY